LTIALQDPLECGESFEPDGAASMETISGNADFSAEAIFKANSKAGG
jgi:hypothetical protein